MEVVVNLKHTLDVKAGIQPVLKDEVLIFVLIWFQRSSNIWNSVILQWIQFLEQGLSEHEYLFQIVQCERQLVTTPIEASMPC
jgi:hypothetical protein